MAWTIKNAGDKAVFVDIVWGELDFLFIDLPPGTGDEPLSIAQLLPDLDGVVIVTMPPSCQAQLLGKQLLSLKD